MTDPDQGPVSPTSATGPGHPADGAHVSPRPEPPRAHDWFFTSDAAPTSEVHPSAAEATTALDTNPTQPLAVPSPVLSSPAPRGPAYPLAPPTPTPYQPAASPGGPTPYPTGAAPHWTASGPHQPLPPVVGSAPYSAVHPFGMPGDASAAALPAGGSPRPRRGALLVGAVTLGLVSAVIGGAMVALVDGRPAARGGSALPEPAAGSTARPDGSIAQISARALPSVVTIRVRGSGASGTGSGFVIDDKGHILTNNHVVPTAVDDGEITVLFAGGASSTGTVVGRDVSYDLAVVQVAKGDVTPLEFGRSSDVVVGDGVIAVGAPLGLDATVTSGIVSALNRPVSAGDGDEQSYINAIQTDAAINPGNSGGPLLDMSGRVIGINSAIARVPGVDGGTVGSIGVGFAIPSDQARKTAEQLITNGKAVHPVIGIQIDRAYAGEGVRILDEADGVTPAGPAAAAGLRPGDTITVFDGRAVTTPDELVVAIRAKSVGDVVALTVTRGNAKIEVTMTLAGASS